MRVILDTNVWTYLARSEEVTKLDDLIEEKGFELVVPPSILLEALRARDPSVRSNIVGAITRRSPGRVHPRTEAQQTADEVVGEIRRLRPGWIRGFPSTSRLPVLENFWTKTIWQQAATDPTGVAERVQHGSPEIEAADQHLYEVQEFNKTAFTASGLSRTWDVEPRVDLSEGHESDQVGWDGDRIAFWRVDNASTWWAVLRRGATDALHRTLHDWFSPWIRRDAIIGDREDWNRFWYYDAQGANLSRNWMTSLMPWAQILRKLGEGNPRDTQHAVYLYDADVFFTADRRYAASLEHLRPWSPASFARAVRVSASPLAEIEAELREGEARN